MAKRKSDGEDIEGIEAANERDMQALKDAERPARQEQEDEGPLLEFAESGADEGDDHDDAPPPPSSEERPSRRERRQGRYRDVVERERQATERADRLEAEVRQLRQQPPTPQQQPQQVPQGPSIEQYDGAIEANLADQQRLAQHYQLRLQELKGQMSPEEERDFLSRSNQLKNQESDLRVWRSARQHGFQPHQPAPDPYAAYLYGEYADVVQVPERRAYTAYLYRAALSKGDADGPQLLKRVLEDTRKHFAGDQRGARRPTTQGQSRYTGSAPGQSPARGAGRVEGSSSNRVVLPDGLSLKEFKQMADKMYPHIKDENKRYTHYYRQIVEPEQRGRD